MNDTEIREYLKEVPGAPTLRYFPHAVAEELSDLPAILLYDLHGRIKRQKKPLVKDQRTWTFDAMRVFAEEHPYASEPGIRKAFLALESAGFIRIEKSGKWNQKGFDRKWWFHVTAPGIAAAKRRRIRYNPTVAAARDIPEAVLLETFRYHLHLPDAGESVTLNPQELDLPYSSKTIERHLKALVESGILEPDDDKKWHFRLPATPVVDWRKQREPLTVSPTLLLPKLENGAIGLLVGHSGTGKTSYTSFAAVQLALSGKKVLYVTLEEPQNNIVHRMYAQEVGVPYSDLHQGNGDVIREVQTWMDATSARQQALMQNMRFGDISGQHSQTHELLDAIHRIENDGFTPDVIFIDQLEFVEVMDESYEGDTEGTAPGTQSQHAPLQSSTMSTAIAAALAMKECLSNLPCAIWVLHQAMGQCQLDFVIKDIAGGIDVASQFDQVVGIGRATKDSEELRIFSMSSAIPFEITVDTDFPHMRFKPQ